jgi:hypothetical protein
MATVYSSSDGEVYQKDFHLSRNKDGFVEITKDGQTIPELKGGFTQYVLAKAAINHYLAKAKIANDITIQTMPEVQARKTSN